MKVIFLILILMLYFGLMVFCSKREHFLVVLLRLEYVILGLYFFIFLIIGMERVYYSLIFVVFTACEGALGLSILVVISRTHGVDYFKSFNMVA